LTPRSSALLPVRITTARRPDHIRLSALVRSRSAQFIVHASSQLDRGPPKRGHFPAILVGFLLVCHLRVSGRRTIVSWCAISELVEDVQLWTFFRPILITFPIPMTISNWSCSLNFFIASGLTFLLLQVSRFSKILYRFSQNFLFTKAPKIVAILTLFSIPVPISRWSSSHQKT